MEHKLYADLGAEQPRQHRRADAQLRSAGLQFQCVHSHYQRNADYDTGERHDGYHYPADEQRHRARTHGDKHRYGHSHIDHEPHGTHIVRKWGDEFLLEDDRGKRRRSGDNYLT